MCLRGSVYVCLPDRCGSDWAWFDVYDITPIQVCGTMSLPWPWWTTTSEHRMFFVCKQVSHAKTDIKKAFDNLLHIHKSIFPIIIIIRSGPSFKVILMSRS